MTDGGDLGRPFAGSVALVTGGSRGIGAAVCKALAQRGAYVYINYHKQEQAAASVLETLRSVGADGRLVQASVAERDSVTRMFEQIRRGSGRLDMLVNNAAVLDDHLLGMMSDEQWHDVISTNLDGLFYCTREAVRLMIRHKSGRIVNMELEGAGSAETPASATTRRVRLLLLPSRDRWLLRSRS